VAKGSRELEERKKVSQDKRPCSVLLEKRAVLIERKGNNQDDIEERGGKVWLRGRRRYIRRGKIRSSGSSE